MAQAVATASDLNDAAIALLHAVRAIEAAAGFRAAIAVSPSAESHYNLGIALKDQHRHRESVVAYYAALALRPEFAECHFNAGRAFQMLSDDPGAGGALRNFTDRRDVLLRAARISMEALIQASDDDQRDWLLCGYHLAVRRAFREAGQPEQALQFAERKAMMMAARASK